MGNIGVSAQHELRQRRWKMRGEWSRRDRQAAERCAVTLSNVLVGGKVERGKLTRSLGSWDAIEFEVLVMVMSATGQLTSVWKKSARHRPWQPFAIIGTHSLVESLEHPEGLSSNQQHFCFMEHSYWPLFMNECHNAQIFEYSATFRRFRGTHVPSLYKYLLLAL
jgi:hypothetical protein